MAKLLFGLYMANPFAMIIGGYRHALFYGTYVPAAWWVALIGEAALVLFLGYKMFQYYDRRIIKFL